MSRLGMISLESGLGPCARRPLLYPVKRLCKAFHRSRLARRRPLLVFRCPLPLNPGAYAPYPLLSTRHRRSLSCGWTNLFEDFRDPYRWDPKASNQTATETIKIIKEGVVLEFQSDSGNSVLGVVHGQEGKRNWSVIDQDEERHTVRPNQIKFIVPGVENLCAAELRSLQHKSKLSQDPFLLEIAWEELVKKNKMISIEELSLILYGNASPEKCYSAYQMLSSNPVFFSCKDKGYFPIYEPRPVGEVKELQLQRLRETAAQMEFMEFVDSVKLAMQEPFSKKPPQSTWHMDGKSRKYTDILRAYALDASKASDEKLSATQILDALGVQRSPSAAVNVLIEIGYFPLHVNLELLKSKLRIDFSNHLLMAADVLANEPPYDIDKDNRVDLTSLKVYTIDSDYAEEIDDGLSASKLPDGRTKVWIHVADPTRWVGLNTELRKEASHRGTSVYLPTESIPMFPMKLSKDLMSLRQNIICPAVSVAAIISQDGSIEDSTVENSIIKPTYKLSYDAACELLSLKLEEEDELSLLFHVSKLRHKWRLSKGANVMFTVDANIRVKDADSTEPVIMLSVYEEVTPAMLLVSEMMILCNEVIAKFGEKHELPLPYRGQSQSEYMKKESEMLPEGPARSMAMIRLSRADMSFARPLQHSSLGLSGYVQFSSPLRRYSDLLAHYQVKAAIRGEAPPFSSGHLEVAMSRINSVCRIAKKLQLDSERYWMLVYLQQQPRGKTYRAVVLRLVGITEAVVLLLEVGLHISVQLKNTARIGQEILLYVEDAQPRKDTVILKEHYNNL